MRAENVCKPLSIKGNVEKVLSERKEKKYENKSSHTNKHTENWNSIQSWTLAEKSFETESMCSIENDTHSRRAHTTSQPREWTAQTRRTREDEK